MRLKQVLLSAVLVLGIAWFLGCTRKVEVPPTLDVNLYSGVQAMAKIGDSEGQVLDRAKRWKPEVIELPRQVNDERVSWSKLYQFKELGMRVYFRHAWFPSGDARRGLRPIGPKR